MIRRLSAVASAAALAAGCQSVPSEAPKASAHLQPTRGSTVSGHVDFVQLGARVRVTAHVEGL